MMETVRRLPIPGEIIDQKHESACLERTCRVLDVHEGLNRIVVIPVEPRKKQWPKEDEKKNGRIYFLGPRIVELERVLDDLDQQRLEIIEGGVSPRPDAAATEEELDKKYKRKKEEISIPRRQRKERYELIKPLVEDPEDMKLLFEPQIRLESVTQHAKNINDGKTSIARTIKMINELLNQYWAGGSTPGALTPFSAAKGGRGKERTQRKKLGRPNILTANGQLGQEGFVMQERDKEICGFCWRNYYIRGATIEKVHRRMQREFYSELEEGEDGKIHRRIYPANKCPSKSQLLSWGVERSPGHESWKKQLTKFNLGRIDRALFGTATDDVVAVGQRGSIDSTSPDIEFVRVENRLERIGPAHRILVVDTLYGYIPGFYLGLDAPSARTVQLAYLHALTEKSEWLEWLGLNIDPDDWLRIRFQSIFADNTDARCEEVIKQFSEVGTGLKFVGVARSDLNSPSETSHHILHRMVDHNLHGTTRGQDHERGEERADVLARHTIIEAIRETARAIHTHNTMELEINPTLEMRRELLDKGIKLTRLNLTRWTINRGKVAVSLIGTDEARVKLMPTIRGCFTQHGIKLLRPDSGRKREFVEPIRYISKHPLIVERVMKAKVGRGRLPPESFDDDFRLDPYAPTKLFYRDPIGGELISLNMVTKDVDLPFECTLYDMLDLMKCNGMYKFNARSLNNDALNKMETGQEQTKQEAADAYEQDLAKTNKPPSKSAIRRNKKQNREAEKNTYQYGMPIQTPSNIADLNYEEEMDTPSGDKSGLNPLSAANDDLSRKQNVKRNDMLTRESKSHKGNSLLSDAILQRRKKEDGGHVR